MARMRKASDPLPTSEERHLGNSRQLIAAMSDGRFADALPFPYYDHLMAWINEQIAQGDNEIVVSIVTDQGGLISFLYDIVAGDTGLLIGPALEYSVPRNAADRDVDITMLGKPSIALDVSSLRKARQVA